MNRRRGLIGLTDRPKPGQTPIEVISVTRDGTSHAVLKQKRAVCANGIDTWWLETTCGLRLVVTVSADRGKPVTCLTCVTATDPVKRI
jgi:hypothetical protein